MERPAGIHLPWKSTPADVKQRVARSLGSDILRAVDVGGGFSPGCCTLLSLADGRRMFVKAVSDESNAESPQMHRREAKIVAALPKSRHLPRFIAYDDDGSWVVHVYEAIPGRLPTVPWSEEELQRVIDGLIAMHEVLTPCPVQDLESTAEYFDAMFRGWRTMSGEVKTPSSLDDWTRRNLNALADLEARWTEAAVGDALVHGDIRSDNVLMTESSVVFVDWPHASRGPPLFDLIFWAPSVTLEGGPEPEQLLMRSRHRRVDPGEANAVIAALAGFFTYSPTLPAPPGLPTLRAFQEAQGGVARKWLRERAGLR
ncbi:MAG TPA: aminoglycoside phosphotransferase family protein [Acidimicrobiales bacterium]|nr:aminoglycoside phosphotransferase family protein [Acidimicrobiales bacterium]